jgi:hypothetical protein
MKVLDVQGRKEWSETVISRDVKRKGQTICLWLPDALDVNSLWFVLIGIQTGCMSQRHQENTLPCPHNASV